MHNNNNKDVLTHGKSKLQFMPRSEYSNKGSAGDPHTQPSICQRSKSPRPLLFYFLIFSIIILLGFYERFKSKLSTTILGIKRANSTKHEASAIVELPPLEELVAQNGTIIGDISWMLDFAVIAFPKAGTTFMKDFLNQTEETYVFERELCMKHCSDVANFVKTYYDLHVKFKQPRYPKTIQFGLKCPGVFYRANDVHIYTKYFPRTKFIIGLRHPVSWFESFYNYQEYRNVSLPDTSQLIGRCSNHQKVCTDRARFHAALARLGKTPMEDGKEIDLLLGSRYDEEEQNVHQNNNDNHANAINHQHHRYLKKENIGVPNQVLLYEVRQIHDKEASKELSSSIREYLGIQEDFPAISSYKQNKTRTINICNAKHDNVRRLLVEHSTDAAIWIQNYFLKNPTVDASSPHTFQHFLSDWSIDPCSNHTIL